MSVSTHLGIALPEYDRRIRSFIPFYGEMLDAAAGVLRIVPSLEPTIVDLGIGTGALAACCLAIIPRARIVGLDADPEILALARRRLARRARGRLMLQHANFLDADIPRCEAIVASLALHHIPTKPAKLRFYRRAFAALRPTGLLLSADCHTGSSPRIDAELRRQWRNHLLDSYPSRRADGFLRAWAREDFYFPLEDERRMLEEAGFAVDIVWRRAMFAVLAATRP
jgi:SAM-dependent methyltransferase